MKLLELVHKLDDTSRTVVAKLDELINDEDTSAVIPMPGLKSIHLVVSIQMDLIKRLLEENQSIKDELEKFLSR